MPVKMNPQGSSPLCVRAAEFLPLLFLVTKPEAWSVSKCSNLQRARDGLENLSSPVLQWDDMKQKWMWCMCWIQLWSWSIPYISKRGLINTSNEIIYYLHAIVNVVLILYLLGNLLFIHFSLLIRQYCAAITCPLWPWMALRRIILEIFQSLRFRLWYVEYWVIHGVLKMLACVEWELLELVLYYEVKVGKNNGNTVVSSLREEKSHSNSIWSPAL